MAKSEPVWLAFLVRRKEWRSGLSYRGQSFPRQNSRARTISTLRAGSPRGSISPWHWAEKVDRKFYVMQGDFYLTGDPTQSGVHEAVVDKMVKESRITNRK